MRLRNAKKEPTPEPADRRRRSAAGTSSPAFSYYANRTPELTRSRSGPAKERQDASSKPLKSPRRTAAMVPFWLLVVVAVVCVGKVLFLSTDPKVIVVGKNTTTADYVQSGAIYETAARKLLSGSITNRSKLTADFSGTSEQMRMQFPELQDVSMGVPLMGNRPIVYVQVASPSLVLQTPSGNFALSSSGVVLARLRAVPSGIPVIVDQSGTAPRTGKQYLPSSTVLFARTVAFQLAAAHLTVNTFVLPPGTPYELDVRLAGQSYLIRCNLEADAVTQSGAVVATVQQLGAAVPANYLDVRVPGRVYYK